MTKREGYPLNYEFWDNKGYNATINWNGHEHNGETVRVIGEEEVITNWHGWDIPDGFLLIEYPDGHVSAMHRRWLE